MSKRLTLILGMLALASLVLAACGQQVVTVEVPGEVVTVEVVEEVEVPVTEEAAPEGECCEPYRIGIFEDPLTTNYWSYLGPDNSVWTAYILSGSAASLYSLSDQRFDFVPSLATALPPEPVEEGDFWVIEVEMVQDATWSDGEPVTAHDVAFTVMTALDLQLGGNWVSIYPPDLIDRVEAVDDYTVKFYFLSKPGLAKWQYGAAQGPILPEHVFADAVAEARTFIEGIEEPEADCSAEDLSEEDQAACDAYAEAFQNARQTLYSFDATGVPVFGGYTTDTLEPGAFVERNENPNFYFKGARIIEYDDGTWVLEHPNGTVYQLYGEGTGEEILNYETGPFNPNVIFTLYGSQDAAFLALADGEVDYVLNPLSLSPGLQAQAEEGEGVRTIVNQDNGVFYLAFNFRKDPYGQQAFRDAVNWLIDKEFVADTILQGTVLPAYSVVPSGNAFWWNPDVATPQVGATREERVNMAVQILQDAGWSWETAPAWDEDLQDVVPGEGLLMPNGEPMPETTILGPGPAYDPQRATFNQWISEWLREMGMPVESELTGFNTILTPVFVEANFDMYILGWSLTIYPDYLCDFFQGKWGVLEGGQLVGYNTPGMADPDFDAACDEFLAETDVERAQELALQLQDTLNELLPYIPLFYRPAIDLIRSNVVLPYTDTLGGVAEAAGFQTDSQVLSR